jgi:hypothetical protein
MLFTFICHLFVNKVIETFKTKKDYPLETPFVTGPLSIDEFVEATEKHINKQPVDHKNLIVVAKGPTPVLTFGLALILINASLVKTGVVTEAIKDQMKGSASAFTSHSRTSAKKISLEKKRLQEIANESSKEKVTM